MWVDVRSGQLAVSIAAAFSIIDLIGLAARARAAWPLAINDRQGFTPHSGTPLEAGCCTHEVYCIAQ